MSRFGLNLEAWSWACALSCVGAPRGNQFSNFTGSVKTVTILSLPRYSPVVVVSIWWRRSVASTVSGLGIVGSR